jgi:hypothetical protein
MTQAEQLQSNNESFEATFGKLFAERDYFRDRLFEAEKIMSKIADFCEVMVVDGHVTDIDELENFVELFKFLKRESAADLANDVIFKQSTGL